MCISSSRALSYGTIIPSLPVNSEYTGVTVQKPLTGFIFVAVRDTVVADLATGKNRGWPGWSLAWPDDRWGPLVGSDGCTIRCWALQPSFTLSVALGKRGRHLGFESGIAFASPDGLGVCWAPLTGSEGPQR